MSTPKIKIQETAGIANDRQLDIRKSHPTEVALTRNTLNDDCVHSTALARYSTWLEDTNYS